MAEPNANWQRPSLARLLGVVSAVLLAAMAVPGLDDAVRYFGELAAGNPVHALSAVGLVAGVVVPVALALSFVRTRPGRLVGVASVLVGVGFVWFASEVYALATSACPPNAYCVEPAWWRGSVLAALAYLASGVGLVVAGLVAEWRAG